MGDKPRAHYVHSHYLAGYVPQVVKLDTKSCIKLNGTPLKDFVDFGKFGTCCYGGSSSTHGYLTTGHSLSARRSLDNTLCDTADSGVSPQSHARSCLLSPLTRTATFNGELHLPSQAKMHECQISCEGYCFWCIKNDKIMSACVFILRTLVWLLKIAVWCISHLDSAV